MEVTNHLLLPELLVQIFGLLDEESLLSAAFTCKNFLQVIRKHFRSAILHQLYWKNWIVNESYFFIENVTSVVKSSWTVKYQGIFLKVILKERKL